MRVGVDATSLLGARTGVGHVTAGILGCLGARDDVDVVAFAVTWRGRGDLDAALPPSVPARGPRAPARLVRRTWATVRRPRAEWWTGPVDVVHAPNFVAPPARAPVVVTVHDLTFVRFPELCTADTRGYPAHLRRAIGDGAVVHAVSDTIAAEVREELDVAPERVRRVYAGIAPARPGDAGRGVALAGGDRYVLSIGTIEPRKNLPNLVRAFDLVAGRDPGLSLVLAGPDGWGVDALDEALGEARHADRVRRLGYVDETARRDLLAGCRALAYPSLYEGFGHPPLEAMAAGVPVVAADAGALPEVLGDAALLPPPGDVEAIADAIGRVLTDDGLRRSLVGRGAARARRYTWAATADELVALYRDVAGAS